MSKSAHFFHIERPWSRGMISACHAGDPGSSPGGRILFAFRPIVALHTSVHFSLFLLLQWAYTTLFLLPATCGSSGVPHFSQQGPYFIFAHPHCGRGRVKIAQKEFVTPCVSRRVLAAVSQTLGHSSNPLTFSHFLVLHS
jgi:hypothetical protein